MSDYRLELKVKNGRLWSAMQEEGVKRAADLSRAANVSPTEVGKMLNLKMTCYNKDMDVRPAVQRVADALCMSPESLFPREQLFEPVQTNTFAAMVSTGEMRRLSAGFTGQRELDPVALLEASQEQKGGGAFARMLQLADPELSPREKRVLTRRFAEARTLDDVAGECDVSKERIRQIEAKALRKLRSEGNIASIEVMMGRDG